MVPVHRGMAGVEELFEQMQLGVGHDEIAIRQSDASRVATLASCDPHNSANNGLFCAESVELSCGEFRDAPVNWLTKYFIISRG